MGESTLQDAYEIAIKVENVLIQGGRLAPRPPMPLFPDVLAQKPIVASIHTFSTSQLLVVVPIASTSSNEFDKIEAMM